jgi:hypothetical protein
MQRIYILPELISRRLKTRQSFNGCGIVDKRCGLVCKKVAIWVENLVNLYVIKERKNDFTIGFLQHF